MKKTERRHSNPVFENATAYYLENTDVLKNIAHAHKGNSTDNQRTRLLAALRKLGRISTIDARKHLDILSPAPRVMELRRNGVSIETVMVRQRTDAGKIHKIGLYVLKVAK